MKRVLIFGLFLLFSLSAATADAADPKFLRIGTASLGGNFFPMGAAIGVVIDQKVPGIKATAQASSGSRYNMTAIQEGEQEIGLCQGTAVADAMAEGKTPDVRTLGNYNALAMHILMQNAANAKSLADLKGKKMEMLAAGDGTEVSTRKMLQAVGIGWDQIKPEYSGNRVQAASRIKTGQVDGIIDGTGLGSAWITDIIGDGSKFSLLPMKEDEVKAVLGTNKEFSRMSIPANTYRGQTQTLDVVGVWTVIVVSKNLSDDLVYNITKQIFDNRQFLRERHNMFRDLAPENIVDAVIAPLHPGAERYYKEIGVLK